MTTELVRKPASASNGGELNETTQTVKGIKTFEDGAVITDSTAVPVGSKIEAQATADFAILTTWENVPLMTVTLTEGVWLVHATSLVRGSSLTSVTVNARLYNSTDALGFNDTRSAMWLVADSADPINREGHLTVTDTITIPKGQSKVITYQLIANAASRADMLIVAGSGLSSIPRIFATKMATVDS